MRAFNPLTQEEYQSTVASWMGAFLVLADHLLLHPHASAASHKAEQQQLPEPDTPPTKQELLRRAMQSRVSASLLLCVLSGGF